MLKSMKVLFSMVIFCFFYQEILAVPISFNRECSFELITYWIKRETGQASESEQRRIEDKLYGQLKAQGYPSDKPEGPNCNWRANGPQQSVYNWTYYLLQTTHRNPAYELPGMRDQNFGWHCLTWMDESTHYMIEGGYLGGLPGAMKMKPEVPPAENVDVRRGLALMYHLCMPTGAWPVMGDRSADVTVMLVPYLYLGAWILQDGTYRYLAERAQEWVDFAGYARGAKWTYGGEPNDAVTALKNYIPPAQKPVRESAYLRAHSNNYLGGGTTKYLDHPHKIVLRDGWDKDSFYVLFHVGTAGDGLHPNDSANGLFYLVWEGEYWMTGHGEDFMNMFERITGNAGKEGLKDGLSSYTEPPYNGKCTVEFHNYPDYSFFTSRHPKKDLRQVIFRKKGYLVVFDEVETKRELRWWFRWNLAEQTKVEKGHIVQEKNGKYFTTKVPDPNWIRSARIKEEDFRGKPGRFPAHWPQNTISGIYQFLKIRMANKSIATVLAPHYKGEAPTIEVAEVKKETGEPAYPSAIGVVVNGELAGSAFQPGTYIYNQIKTNATLINVNPLSSIEEINVMGGDFVEIPLASQPEEIFWVEHEQVPFWEMRGPRQDKISQIRDWTYTQGRLLIKYTGNGTIWLKDKTKIKNLAQKEKQKKLFSFPNPFNPECYILVNVKDKMQNVRCKIYNILGQLVREIECSGVNVQDSRVYWDGKDSRGLEVPAGVYFYEVAGEAVRRMVVLR